MIVNVRRIMPNYAELHAFDLPDARRYRVGHDRNPSLIIDLVHWMDVT